MLTIQFFFVFIYFTGLNYLFFNVAVSVTKHSNLVQVDCNDSWED